MISLSCGIAFWSYWRLWGQVFRFSSSAEEIGRSLRHVISGRFRVLNAKGEFAGKGIIGGAEIVLPSGTYRVETIGSNAKAIPNVIIKPRELTEANF